VEADILSQLRGLALCFDRKGQSSLEDIRGNV